MTTATPGSVITFGLGFTPSLIVTLGYGVGAPVVSSGHSGINRLWLIDYYTKAFEKKKVIETLPQNKLPKAKKRPKRQEIEAEQRIADKIEALVQKAERDIRAMTARIADAQKAAEFTQNLINVAAKSPWPIEDFKSIAKIYEDDEDDLELFAMVL